MSTSFSQTANNSTFAYKEAWQTLIKSTFIRTKEQILAPENGIIVIAIQQKPRGKICYDKYTK